jgi:hypothetical protein
MRREKKRERREKYERSKKRGEITQCSAVLYSAVREAGEKMNL